MPKSHGIKADLVIAGSSVKQYITEIDPEFTRKLDEIFTLGDTHTSQMAGVRMGRISVKGYFDPTLDAAVYGAYNGDVGVAYEYYPQGQGAGLVEYSGNMRVPSYKPGPANRDGTVGFSFEMVNDGDITRGLDT